MSDAFVLREDVGRIACLTLNRPEKLNALNETCFRALDIHIGALALESGRIDCVVLRGAGRCFSAGHDLGEIADAVVPEDVAYESKVLERLADLPQAVIAAVHSHCYTGALELALACDIILASASAKFADTHAKWALTPVWGMSQRLPRRVGLTKARELMFTSRTVGADEAVAIGLANAAFADDAFEAGVLAFARTILDNAAFSIAAYKRLLSDTDAAPLRMGLAHEVHRSEGVGPDCAERIANFAKRKA